MAESKQYQCNQCKLTPWLTKSGQSCICGGELTPRKKSDIINTAFGESFGDILKANKEGK
jgi:hypothetical protein